MGITIYTVIDPKTGKEVSGNIPELCDYFNQKVSTVRSRIKERGWTLEQALTTEVVINSPTYEIVDPKTNELIKGNIAQLSKHFNQKPSTVRFRLEKLNWSLEKALLQSLCVSRKTYSVKDPKTGKKVKGQMCELCRYFGKDRTTVQYRMNKMGWSLEKALITPNLNENMTHPTYMVNDKTGTIPQLCKMYDTKEERVRQRIRNMGMTLEQALNIPKYSHELFKVKDYNTGKYIIGGFGFLLTYFNASRSEVMSKIKAGISLEKALNMSRVKNRVIQENQKNEKYIEIVEYNNLVGSLWAICKYLGLQYSCVRTRVREYNMPIKVAIETPKNCPPSHVERNGVRETLKDYCIRNKKDLKSMFDLLQRLHTLEWATAHADDVEGE